VCCGSGFVSGSVINVGDYHVYRNAKRFAPVHDRVELRGRDVERDQDRIAAGGTKAPGDRRQRLSPSAVAVPMMA
jgi:hypothetical protein